MYVLRTVGMYALYIYVYMDEKGWGSTGINDYVLLDRLAKERLRDVNELRGAAGGMSWWRRV